MKTIGKILLATKVSRATEQTLRYASDMAEAFDARLHVLSVVEPMSEDARITLETFVQDEQARHHALHGRVQARRKELDTCIERFREGPLAGDHDVGERIDEITVVEGFPADVILHRAESEGFDLLLCGTHEQAVNNTFLGNVAKRVLRRTRVPVLLVPYRADFGTS